MKFKPHQKYVLERLEGTGWVGKDSGYITPLDGPVVGDYVRSRDHRDGRQVPVLRRGRNAYSGV